MGFKWIEDHLNGPGSALTAAFHASSASSFGVPLDRKAAVKVWSRRGRPGDFHCTPYSIAASSVPQFFVEMVGVVGWGLGLNAFRGSVAADVWLDVSRVGSHAG